MLKIGGPESGLKIIGKEYNKLRKQVAYRKLKLETADARLRTVVRTVALQPPSVPISRIAVGETLWIAGKATKITLK